MTGTHLPVVLAVSDGHGCEPRSEGGELTVERAPDRSGASALPHELWLDKHLAMSCGLWTDATDLETAQLNKYRLMARWAGVAAGSRVLDVGSGFGGMLRHLSEEHGVAAACGLDLSGEACRVAEGLGLRGVTVRNGDYRAFVPEIGRAHV